MKNKLLGPIDRRLLRLPRRDMIVVATEVFAFLPTRWHGEVVSIEELMPYIHPDLVSQQSIDTLKDFKVLRVSTPFFPLDFNTYMNSARVDGVPFEEDPGKALLVMRRFHYAPLMAFKLLCSKEFYFKNVFDNKYQSEDLARKIVYRKRVTIDLERALEIARKGFVETKKDKIEVNISDEVIADLEYVANICNSVTV